MAKLLLHSRNLLQEDDPFRNSESPSLSYAPDPLHHPANSSSSSSETAFRRPFPPNSTPFDSSMALTILVLLTALFFMGFFSLYIRRFADSDSDSSSRPADDTLPRRRHTPRSPFSSSHPSKGLDPAAVRSLPLIRYGADAKHPNDCSICLSEFEDRETVKIIPYCRHGFHPQCIDTWLSSHVSCPLCRSTQLFVEDEVSLSVVQEHGNDGVSGSSTVDDDHERTTGTVRRVSSCSSFRDPVSLQRTTSF